LRDQISVESVEGSAQSHAGGGHGSFAAGVACSDYGNVEMF
jgi:hypothetical protein